MLLAFLSTPSIRARRPQLLVKRPSLIAKPASIALIRRRLQRGGQNGSNEFGWNGHLCSTKVLLGSSRSLICTRPQNRSTGCRLRQQPVSSAASSLYVFFPRIENSNHSCIFMHLLHTAIDLSPLPAEEACKQILQPSNPCWRYPRLVLFQLTNKLLLVEDLKGGPNNSTTKWYGLLFHPCELWTAYEVMKYWKFLPLRLSSKGSSIDYFPSMEPALTGLGQKHFQRFIMLPSSECHESKGLPITGDCQENACSNPS